MKSFDLEAAKNGAPVCTRDGKPARIICFDRKSTSNFPIIALVRFTDGIEEQVIRFTKDGKFFNLPGMAHYNCNDLVMIEEIPQYEFKPFDKVLVRNPPNGYTKGSYEWTMGFYEKRFMSEKVHKIMNSPYAWEQCIPYEGNEDKLGTTCK